jgi:predicted nucleic acid-binding protein
MAGYLVDTSIISALAPGKPSVPPMLADWLRSRTAELYLPSIAIAEIEEGICKLRRQGGCTRAAALTRWLDELVFAWGPRILPVDTDAARLAGQLADKAVAGGRHPGFPDVAVAAIAAQNTLVILTRNIRHFAALGVPHQDPLVHLPH